MAHATAPRKHRIPRWLRWTLTGLAGFIVLIAVLAVLAVLGAIGGGNKTPHAASTPRAATSTQPAAPATTEPAAPAQPAAATPSTAGTILASDGYTVTQDMTASQLASTNGKIDSAATGTNGDNGELVIVTTIPATADLLTAAMKPAAAANGVTINRSGIGTIRFTGTTAGMLAFSAQIDAATGNSGS